MGDAWFSVWIKILEMYSVLEAFFVSWMGSSETVELIGLSTANYMFLYIV